MPDKDVPSFGDMLAGARQRSGRTSGYDDLPKVSRSFGSVRDQECESGYAGPLCERDIDEGAEAAFVDDQIACETCFTQAQETRDEYFER